MQQRHAVCFQLSKSYRKFHGIVLVFAYPRQVSVYKKATHATHQLHIYFQGELKNYKVLKNLNAATIFGTAKNVVVISL